MPRLDNTPASIIPPKLEPDQSTRDFGVWTTTEALTDFARNEARTASDPDDELCATYWVMDRIRRTVGLASRFMHSLEEVKRRREEVKRLREGRTS